MIIIPNSKKDVFLTTYDVNYETGEYKTTVINSKGEEIYKDFEKVEAIQNSDQMGNLIYEQNVLRVQKDGKYGIISLEEGKEILPCEYEKIEAVTGIENALQITKDGKIGIADCEGKIIAEPEYLEVQNLGEDNKAGYIIKTQDGKYGVIDYSNKTVVEAKYDKIEKEHGNNYYIVTVDGKQKLIKKDGTEVLTLDNKYKAIKSILKDEENGIIVQKDDKFGIIKTTGEEVLEAKYEYLKEAKSEFLIAKKDGKYGVIDLSGNEKVPFNYQSISYEPKADLYIAENEDFESEILDGKFNVKKKGMLVDVDYNKEYLEFQEDGKYKYYNFKLEEKKETEIFSTNTLFVSKKDGKFGFVGKDGEEKVEYKYDDATKQNAYGYAGIKKDGKWGVVDNKGTVILEPTYDLEEYLKIDFVGKWHLGMDLNMNYYNKN